MCVLERDRERKREKERERERSHQFISKRYANEKLTIENEKNTNIL